MIKRENSFIMESDIKTISYSIVFVSSDIKNINNPIQVNYTNLFNLLNNEILLRMIMRDILGNDAKLTKENEIKGLRTKYKIDDYTLDFEAPFKLSIIYKNNKHNNSSNNEENIRKIATKLIEELENNFDTKEQLISKIGINYELFKEIENPFEKIKNSLSIIQDEQAEKAVLAVSYKKDTNTTLNLTIFNIENDYGNGINYRINFDININEENKIETILKKDYSFKEYKEYAKNKIISLNIK